MKILKQISWALGKSKIEKNLTRFCDLEYKPADRSWALHRAMREHKANYFGEQ
jgi:hypothetical protein